MRNKIKTDAHRKRLLLTWVPYPTAATILIYFVLALAGAVTELSAYPQSAPTSAGVRLQGGIEKEEVDGDLKSAMEIYQKIGSDGSAPREVRARALLRLARCEEKLGRQAIQVYEQIVRDYTDQPAAAQARQRLASLKQQDRPKISKTLSVRRIDGSAVGRFGSGDTDGERVVYRDGDMLYFGDLSGHNRKTVMKNLTRYGWSTSRDFSMVSLNLLATPNRRHTLAVVKTDGTRYRELIRDDTEDSLLADSPSFGMNFSWDDRSLLICDFPQKSKLLGSLWIVSVADGRRRELAHFEGERIHKAVFSPDGRFIAFEVVPKEHEEGTLHGTSRIFIVPVRGGEPRLVYETGPWQTESFLFALKDWTPDGRFLAIGDFRQGKRALYLLPMKDGAATGDPIFLRLGDFLGGDMTATGALVYDEQILWPNNLDVSLASFDSNGHLGNWQTLKLRKGLVNQLSFSPDSTQISYTIRDPDETHSELIVRDLATGQERAMYQSSYIGLYCQFSTHTPKVFCTKAQEDGKTALISVDTISAAIDEISVFSGFRRIDKPPLDDRVFVLDTGVKGSGDTAVLRWNRNTGEEAVLVPRSEDMHHEVLSWDARWLLRWNHEFNLDVRSASESGWKTLVSGMHATFMVPVTTPDGNWVFYAPSDPAGKHILFRVPIAGGKPELVGNLPRDYWAGSMFLSADGHHALALDSDSRHDCWMLENFEPPIKK